MSEDPIFTQGFNPPPGELQQLSPLVRRILANNPGPFTFRGTCTYVVGHGKVAVIDPGPEDPKHVASLLAALQGETIVACVITHTHRDHSPAARLIQAATGARIIGCGPHIAARDLALGEANVLDAANDLDHKPELQMHEGDVFGEGFTLRALETPGHTMNHLAFELPEEQTLFSGDHVMAWSTTSIAPPDGAMQPYMASLEKLLAYDHKVYWPGHGGPVEEPQRLLRGLLHHRRMREQAILSRLLAGDTKIETIVANIYKGLDPRLHKGACLSVLAHLEALCIQEKVTYEDAPTLDATYHAI